MSYLISEPGLHWFGLVSFLDGFACRAAFGAGDPCLVVCTLPVGLICAAGGDTIDGSVDLIFCGQYSHLLTRSRGLHRSDD